MSDTQQPLPPRLPKNFLNQFGKLSHDQAGHLRHFHNLATRRDGDWGPMGLQEPGQEWLDAYRYQLATMAYAAGVAHYHRLPALRSPFKSLMECLIRKMLRREVWGYWFLTSHSGIFVDPDIEELRKPWADPIARENIMYSGHLLLMVALYTMLFNDDKYNEEGALTFNWCPIFWGMGPEQFSYTRQSLQRAILAEMEREKWLGVCCEPNSIFVVCNQFPIIAMRYNDIRDGTNVATEVLEKYTAAWEEKGMTDKYGLFIQWSSPKQGTIKSAPNLGFTAWAAAFMNAWNPIIAHQTFENQAVGFLSRVEADRVNLNPAPLALAIRDLVEKDGRDPDCPSTIRRAQELVAKKYGPPELPFSRPQFGYVLEWVSEVGDKAMLEGLLNHADRYFQPTWQDGGLYYPVQPQEPDSMNWTEVEPFTGNSAIGYARLNVFDGQRKMWTDPWTPDHVSSAPFVNGINLDSGIDFLRGCWDELYNAMVVTMRSWDGTSKKVRFECCNLPVGQYGVYNNSNLTDVRNVIQPGNTIEVFVDINGKEYDIVLLKAQTGTSSS